MRAPQLLRADGVAHALSARDGALLARLALEGAQPRARLAAWLWPDVDAEVAARLVISGLITQLVWQARAGDVPAVAIDTDRLVDSTIELLLHGLRPVTLTT